MCVKGRGGARRACVGRSVQRKRHEADVTTGCKHAAGPWNGVVLPPPSFPFFPLTPSSLPLTPTPLQFSLIGGFFDWLCSKPDVNILIVGLDNAGKTVRGPPPPPFPLAPDCVCVQTMLEQIKGIYTKATAIPPSRIPPTVGMNSYGL